MTMFQIALPHGFQTELFTMSDEYYPRQQAQDEDPNAWQESYMSPGPFATGEDPNSILYPPNSASHFDPLMHNVTNTQTWSDGTEVFGSQDMNATNNSWGSGDQDYNTYHLQSGNVVYYQQQLPYGNMTSDLYPASSTGVETQMAVLALQEPVADETYAAFPGTTQATLPEGAHQGYQEEGPDPDSFPVATYSQSDTSDQEAGPSTAPGKPYRCEPCDENFANQKNLERHFLSGKHNSDVAKFKCACGFMQARKDNYRRHLLTCAFEVNFVYRCSCGETTQEKGKHEKHIDECGRKRRNKHK
ncbi:hypothetical protein QBC35DRAFT_473408 [Podospora australis]|uniref:C2H2-type domain-containing protein n=1 Tax=Podospora australis TaxID=1536484 RepID=A0AAN6WUQ3_9PEZI|nr:hypothetical protein QBC35DRAFT_473408 [Podospora australis]